MGIIAENKAIYYPVRTEMITERSQWNYWFIIGWHVSIYIYFFNNIPTVLSHCINLIAQQFVLCAICLCFLGFRAL